MADWASLLPGWTVSYGVRTLPPPTAAEIAQAEQHLGAIPASLRDLYGVSNGLTAESLRVLPIETPDDVKRTWEGLRRANDPTKTRFLGRDLALLRRFLVFAVVAGDVPVVLDREDGSIWYQEGADLEQTSLSLTEFVQQALHSR